MQSSKIRVWRLHGSAGMPAWSRSAIWRGWSLPYPRTSRCGRRRAPPEWLRRKAPPNNGRSSRDGFRGEEKRSGHVFGQALQRQVARHIAAHQRRQHLASRFAEVYGCVRCYSGVKRVVGLYPRAGEAEIHADLAGAARQEVTAADVWEQADPGLRHREQHALVGDAMAPMHRDADASAHHEAVQERNIGLGIVLDPCVQDVLVAIEIENVGRCRLARFVQSADVPAGAEGALARALNDDGLHRVVAHPRVKLRRHRQAHRMRQRVQRLGPVERDQPDRAAAFEEDFRSSLIHAPKPPLSSSAERRRSTRSIARSGRRRPGSSPTASPQQTVLCELFHSGSLRGSPRGGRG